ncbi:hypothetical protein ALC53_05395 [Atta colombica]|uniref:Uncharacterized protein n=1 Tax=Atta colombica TaxID=520822 RepID=A0A195BIW8_9HYME|nr:hypothetical protein ALC53_05395 [Atta colombica]
MVVAIGRCSYGPHRLLRSTTISVFGTYLKVNYAAGFLGYKKISSNLPSKNFERSDSLVPLKKLKFILNFCLFAMFDRLQWSKSIHLARCLRKRATSISVDNSAAATTTTATTATIVAKPLTFHRCPPILSNLTKNDSNCRDIVSFTQIQMDDRERLTLVTWWSSDIIPTVKYNSYSHLLTKVP